MQTSSIFATLYQHKFMQHRTKSFFFVSSKQLIIFKCSERFTCRNWMDEWVYLFPSLSPRVRLKETGWQYVSQHVLRFACNCNNQTQEHVVPMFCNENDNIICSGSVECVCGHFPISLHFTRKHKKQQQQQQANGQKRNAEKSVTNTRSLALVILWLNHKMCLLFIT